MVLRRASTLTTLLVTIHLLPACPPADGPGALWTPVIDTLPGGIVRVRNTGPTSWADTNGWRLVLDRTIQPADRTPGELIAPSGMVVDTRGRIFVLDQKPAVIKVFDSTGSFAGTIGREGSGPGEFRNGMFMIARDTLLVQDPNQSRATTFGPDGRFLKTWASLCCFWRSGLVADHEGRVPIPVQLPADDQVGADGGPLLFAGAGVVRYRLDGTAVDTVALPPSRAQRLWRVGSRGGDALYVIPFQPGRLHVLDREGRLIYGDQGQYRMIISRTGRDTARIVESSAAPIPLPDSIRRAHFDQVVKTNEPLRAVAKYEDLPETYPLWTGLVTDADNRLWVLRPGPRGEGDVWDVFTPDGLLLGSVPAPFHQTWNTFWTSDRVYVLDESDQGEPRIRVFRIERRGH